MLEIFNGIKRLFVMVISPEAYNTYLDEAEKLIEDKDDVPRHFRQEIFGERIKVLSTKDVIRLYPLKD